MKPDSDSKTGNEQEQQRLREASEKAKQAQVVENLSAEIVARGQTRNVERKGSGKSSNSDK